MQTGPELSAAPARRHHGGQGPPPPPSLPLLARALPRAEPAAPAAPRARRPQLGQLRRAPLQQLLPAPRAAPLQVPQLLLVPPLQLHDALQLPQLLQAGGPWLCGGRGEVRRREGAPPRPAPESRTLPGFVPKITRTQQALPAASFVASCLALAPAAARATGWADRCPGGPWFWQAPPRPPGGCGSMGPL